MAAASSGRTASVGPGAGDTNETLGAPALTNNNSDAAAAAVGAEMAEGVEVGETSQEDGLLLSQDFIRHGLSKTADPLQFVDELQTRHGSGLQGCEPVLWLLESLGMRRNELLRGLFQNLKAKLLTHVRTSSKTQLAALLSETLPLLSHPTLEEVPLRILSAISEPSPDILEQLSQLDTAALEKLPKDARQSLWEEYPDTFLAHVDPIIERFVHDSAATTWCDEMFPDINFPPPHKRRQKSTPLQELIGAIGTSAKLYRFLADRIRELFADSGNLRLCALRADLLMGLHDISAQSVLATEPCHEFAWHLDAYVKGICSKAAHAALDMNTARLQKTVVAEIMKLISGHLKPGLASAFASTADIDSSANALFANGKGGLGPRPVKPSSATAHARASPVGAADPTGGSNAPAPQAAPAPASASPEKTIDLNTVLLEAWKKIRNVDRHRLFHYPVVETYPALKLAYEAKITRPMDLQTIEDKIRRKEYQSVDDMRADLNLIADNALTFNGPKHKVAIAARSIMKTKAKPFLNAAAQKYQNALMRQRALEQARLAEKGKAEAENAKGQTSQEGQKEEDSSPLANGQANGVSAREPEEDAERKRERREMERKARERAETQGLLAKVETSGRLRRTISDAAMILASGFTVNALTSLLWFLMGEDVVKREQLPRDSETTRNIVWLLQTGSFARELVLEADRREVVVKALDVDTERKTLPALAMLMSEAVEMNIKASPAAAGGTAGTGAAAPAASGGSSSAGVENSASSASKSPVDPCLRVSIKSDWITRNALLYFYCQRICHRDVALLPAISDLIQNQGAVVTEHPAFLHSLVTAFFIQSQRQNTATGPSWQKGPPHSRPGFPARAVTHHVSGSGLQAPLPASFLNQAIETLFLPEVLRVAPTTTDSSKTAWAHVHLTRLLTLEYTLHTLSQAEVLRFARAALISLSGKAHDVEPNTIMASPELKDVIYERYCAPDFERARRQYEKLFRRMPTLRTQCGLPPIVGAHEGGTGPSPSPSPSPLVSPSPSPYAPSPFAAGSPEDSAAGSSPPPRKRLLDQAVEGGLESVKRSKTSPM
ncbi:Negative elongation factor B [Hondaea fermentalgiana]|uniref:Negative elongation factor B n=1 Tax=Hondaea fermentalgiana TaxID=2315210 RepID=A0A2R5GIN9_9STRA|nr:Negative elongation factor B [Hondaea fermentalgiana]|eukprot:GBG30179.1 Negative elongation factor B [Hondaea fermentalgiana]